MSIVPDDVFFSSPDGFTIPQDETFSLQELSWHFAPDTISGPFPENIQNLPVKSLSATSEIDGWFYKVLISEGEKNRNLLIEINHFGASEWYVNGELQKTFGSVDSFSPFIPSNRPFYLSLNSSEPNLISVRYKSSRLLSGGITFQLLQTLPGNETGIVGNAGFTEPFAHFYNKESYKVFHYIYILLSLLLVLFLTYFYVYWRQRTDNGLYFFLWFIGLLIMINSIYIVNNWLNNGYVILTLGLIYQLLMLLAPLFFIKFIEWLTRKSLFRYALETGLGLFAVYIISVLLLFSGINVLSWFLKISWIVLSLLLFYFLIIVFLNLDHSESREEKSIRFGISATIAFSLCIIPFAIFFYPDITYTDKAAFYISNLAYLPLLICIPLLWTFQFRATIDTLQQNIGKAEKLGKLSLQKEQENSESELRAITAQYQAEVSELQAKALESEKKKRDHAIHQARKLQHSMLPESLPDFPGLDIAAYQLSAEEVGGDYYDFFQPDADKLYSVVGDATGHGMAAGIMVSVCKTALHAIRQDTPVKLQHVLNSTIKKMIKSRIHMAMSILKIQDDKFTVSSAAMPPALFYEAKSKKVHEILKPGLPLGAISNPPYKEESYAIQCNDIIVQYSDGIIELFNEQDEMFGIERLITIIENNHQKSATDISDEIKKQFTLWCGDRQLDDDITFVILKMI